MMTIIIMFGPVTGNLLNQWLVSLYYHGRRAEGRSNFKYELGWRITL